MSPTLRLPAWLLQEPSFQIDVFPERRGKKFFVTILGKTLDSKFSQHQFTGAGVTVSDAAKEARKARGAK